MNTINPNYVPQSFINADTGTVKTEHKELAEKVQAGVQARLDKLPPIGDIAFLAQVANLAPGEVDTQAELTAVLDKFEAAAQKYADENPASSSPQSFTGDIAKFLARAMIEFAGQQRQQAADDRLAARAQAKAELMEQAEKMKTAANQMMSGAITNLVVGTIGSAVSIAGSAKALKGQMSEIGAMNKAATQSATASKALGSLSEGAEGMGNTKGALKGTKVDIDIDIETPSTTPTTRARSNALLPDDPRNPVQKSATELAADVKLADRNFDLASRRAGAEQTKSEIANQFGGAIKGIGSSTDAALQATAKKTEAEGQLDAAESQYYQQLADGKKEIQDTMKEMMSQIINFIKEMKEAEVDAMRALTKV